jgi:peptide/nickel transport system permease protein
MLLAATARRIVELIVTLFVTSVVVFGALYLVPGSPIAYLVSGRSTSPGIVARVTAEYHLNQPFPQRYWGWLSGLFHGNLGRSLVSNETTWELLQPRIATTLMLVVLATLETVVVGVILGALAALRGKTVDSTITVTATVGIGIPAFAAATVLLSLFAVNLRWFPVSGNGTGFLGHLDHVFLPSVALAIASVAYVARLSRSSIREERTKEYVETAAVSGLPRSLTVRHIIRNATPSILTAAGVTFVGLMASEVVVESAFGLNGVGSLLVQSVSAKDFAVVQVIVLLYVAVFMVVNTVVDLAAMKIDPRLAIRAGAR